MNLLSLDKFKNIPNLKLAVIGHVEWVSFLSVKELPKSGLISHAKEYLEEPAGGGSLVAVEMQQLTKEPVHFFTALGRDPIGEKCYERLKDLGLNLNVAWRDTQTRRGISFVDPNGERAITIIGDRLQPTSKDLLPWDELDQFDGVFITAGDSQSINLSRKAKFLAATPRVGIEVLNQSQVHLDLLVGSGLDPGEKYDLKEMVHIPKLRISTKGSEGGESFPGGPYQAIKLNSKVVDSYGCGDKFAAGVTTGLAANWTLEKSIILGANCGAKCATHFGPYHSI